MWVEVFAWWRGVVEVTGEAVLLAGGISTHVRHPPQVSFTGLPLRAGDVVPGGGGGGVGAEGGTGNVKYGKSQDNLCKHPDGFLDSGEETLVEVLRTHGGYLCPRRGWRRQCRVRR